jgi:hypothetical protein
MVDCCEQDNEFSGSIKCGIFLDHLSDYQLLKDSTTWSKVFDVGHEVTKCGTL